VVLAGLKQQELAPGEPHRAIAHAEHGRAREDEVQLRLVVEVTGPAELRLVAPRLRSPAGEHRKRLKQRGHGPGQGNSAGGSVESRMVKN
jgi:hypothetical protein